MARPEAREFGGTRWWLGGMFISMRGIKTGGVGEGGMDRNLRDLAILVILVFPAFWLLVVDCRC